MDLTQLANLGEFVGGVGSALGGIAVVATLIYLAVHVRQSTKQGAADFTYMFSSEFMRMHETTLKSPEVAALLVKLTGDDALTPLEETRAVAYANRLTNQWLSAEVAFTKGLLEPDYFVALQADVGRALAERPRLRPHFEAVIEHYPLMRRMKIFEPFFSNGLTR